MPQAPLLLDLGPCELFWNSVGLGQTVDNAEGGQDPEGAKFTLEYSTVKTMRAKTGEQAHDVIFTGAIAKVTAKLAGLSIEQIAAQLPNATLSDGPTKKKLTINTPTGFSSRDNAHELILKPIIGGEVTTDEGKWIRIPKCFPILNFDLAFDFKGQRGYSVVFESLANLSTGEIANIGIQDT